MMEGRHRTPTREQRVLAAGLWWHTVVMGPAALMVHKSGWTDWSDAAPVRPSHAENESDHFYEAQVWKLSPSPAASEPIRAAAHALHSISAGLELIKLSISDKPCLYAALQSIRPLASVVFSLHSLFCTHCLGF